MQPTIPTWRRAFDFAKRFLLHPRTVMLLCDCLLLAAMWIFYWFYRSFMPEYLRIMNGNFPPLAMQVVVNLGAWIYLPPFLLAAITAANAIGWLGDLRVWAVLVSVIVSALILLATAACIGFFVPLLGPQLLG